MQGTQQEKGSEFLSIDLEHIRKQAMAACAAQFERIDAICLHNTQKVLQAYRECQISSYQFAGTSGYGYSDMGREKLDEVFAHVFKAEKALTKYSLTCLRRKKPSYGPTSYRGPTPWLRCCVPSCSTAIR